MEQAERRGDLRWHGSHGLYAERRAAAGDLSIDDAERLSRGSLTVEVVILGSAAGGGVPQWNCRCPVCELAWAGKAQVRPRTQSSLAVSVDGRGWLLVNA